MEPFVYTHEDQYDTLQIALYPKQTLRAQAVDAKTGRAITATMTVYDEQNNQIVSADVDSVSKLLSTIVDGRKHFTVCATAKGYKDTCAQVAKVSDLQILQLEPRRIRRFVLKNMYFATAKTKILPSSEPALQDLYQLLVDNPDIRIRIIGHTDDVGKDDYNQKLSEGRSRSVKKEMVNRGIDSNRIETTGHGEKDPIVENDSDEHRQMNRRVEIEILGGASVDTFIQNDQLKK
jgi:outer membrane protein OmpA-like peptidoglycan-associated protein